MCHRSMPRLAAVLALAASVALGACSDSTGPRAGRPARVEMVAGNSQTAAAGEPIAQPVVVRVTDARGNPVQGATVTFVVTAGDGRLSFPPRPTDAEGLVRAWWTLGTSAGTPQTLEARLVDASGGVHASVTFAATAVAAAAAGLTAIGDSVAVALDLVDSLAVLLRDRYGNPVRDADVEWAVLGGTGTLASQRTTTDSAGVARNVWMLTGGAAQSPPVAQASVAGFAVRFTVVTALSVQAGDDAVQEPGAAVTVRVGTNGMAGLPIEWEVTSGGGRVIPAAPHTTGGPPASASAEWTLGPQGPQTLTVRTRGWSANLSATAALPGRRTLVADVPGNVLDIDAARVLYLTGERLVLRYRSDGSEVVVLDRSWGGNLTPRGVVATSKPPPIVCCPPGTATYDVLEWRDGVLNWMGQILGYTEPVLAVNGNWAVWGQPLMLGNLAAGTARRLLVNYPELNLFINVGPDGSFVYSPYTVIHGNFGVFLYRDGSISELPEVPYDSRGGYGVQPPWTDGVNVIYVRGFNQWLWHNGAWEHLADSEADLRPPEARVAGGYVAYTRFMPRALPAESAWSQVRLRTPGGADELVSAAARAAHLEALAPDGSVVYTEGKLHYRPFGPQVFTHRFIAYRGGPLVHVGSPTKAAVQWHDGHFYEISGGTVYELSR